MTLQMIGHKNTYELYPYEIFNLLFMDCAKQHVNKSLKGQVYANTCREYKLYAYIYVYIYSKNPFYMSTKYEKWIVTFLMILYTTS